jgi:hypothetical protein
VGVGRMVIDCVCSTRLKEQVLSRNRRKAAANLSSNQECGLFGQRGLTNPHKAGNDRFLRHFMSKIEMAWGAGLSKVKSLNWIAKRLNIGIACSLANLLRDA